MYGFPSSVRILRWSAAAGVVAAATLLPAGPALAGGPTSVLLVAPSTGATASLYTTDTEYGLLEQALGTEPAPEDGAPAVVGGPNHDGVNITWLIHDVAVWRTDHVAVSADGDPWIQTRISFDGEIALDDPGLWHHAADPKLLVDLLGGLGLLDGTGTAVTDATDVSAPVAAPAANTGAPTEAGRPDVWLWLLPGLLAGILIGVAVRPALSLVLRARQRMEPARPRQQLIDVHRS